MQGINIFMYLKVNTNIKVGIKNVYNKQAYLLNYKYFNLFFYEMKRIRIFLSNLNFESCFDF